MHSLFSLRFSSSSFVTHLALFPEVVGLGDLGLGEDFLLANVMANDVWGRNDGLNCMN